MAETTGCLLRLNDNIIAIGDTKRTPSGGLVDIEGDFINTATVTVTLYEADGTTEVVGETWPLSMSYVAASDGVYRGTLQDGLTLLDGAIYKADVIADDGPGSRMRTEYVVKAINRRISALCE